MKIGDIVQFKAKPIHKGVIIGWSLFRRRLKIAYFPIYSRDVVYASKFEIELATQ